MARQRTKRPDRQHGRRTEAKISIPVRRAFLNKQVCLQEAQRLVREGSLRGMTERQIAREIYFHALVYYYCERTGRFPQYKDHANPIDMRDDGDTLLRRAAFETCWLLKKKEKEKA